MASVEQPLSQLLSDAQAYILLHGERHSKVACTYDTIAKAYGDAGQYSEAEVYFGKCFDLRMQQLGPIHELTVDTHYRQGLMKSKRLSTPQETSDYLQHMEECLEMREAFDSASLYSLTQGAGGGGGGGSFAFLDSTMVYADRAEQLMGQAERGSPTSLQSPKSPKSSKSPQSQLSVQSIQSPEGLFRRCIELRRVKFGSGEGANQEANGTNADLTNTGANVGANVGNEAVLMVLARYGALLVSLDKLPEAASTLDECETLARGLYPPGEVLSRYIERAREVRERLSRLGSSSSSVVSVVERVVAVELNISGTALTLMPAPVRASGPASGSVPGSAPGSSAFGPVLGRETRDRDTRESMEYWGSGDLLVRDSTRMQSPAVPTFPAFPVEQQGSTEDVLSSELTLERVYLKHLSRKLRSGELQLLSGEADLNLYMAEGVEVGAGAGVGAVAGADADVGAETEAGLRRLAEGVLGTAYWTLLTAQGTQGEGQEAEGVHARLREFVSILHRSTQSGTGSAGGGGGAGGRNRKISSAMHLYQTCEFAASRAHAAAYHLAGKETMVIKCLNPAVSRCPRDQAGGFVAGLSDALVLLTEAYASLGRGDDALHSARLAVTIAHERLEASNQARQKEGQGREQGLGQGQIVGPTLDVYEGTIVAYCSLASQLERSGMGHLSLEWFERALQAARKFEMDGGVIRELQKSIEMAGYASAAPAPAAVRSPVRAPAPVRAPVPAIAVERDQYGQGHRWEAPSPSPSSPSSLQQHQQQWQQQQPQHRQQQQQQRQEHERQQYEQQQQQGYWSQVEGPTSPQHFNPHQQQRLGVITPPDEAPDGLYDSYGARRRSRSEAAPG
ncbi:hypothetical protein B484DRAFT_44968, partial [Ochromonadaceae sp. CCMP2298]